jgi:hypothetical protein
MELEGSVLERVRTYESMSRWEKSELGRDLRRLGLSYGEIMELISVKKSTLATWCRDVTLTEAQIEAIKERRASTVLGVPRNTQRKRHREVELIAAQAALEAEHLVDDPFWTAGVALYWGEGSKTVRRLAMANADPAALRMFKRWSEGYLPPNHGWRARLNLHADNNELAAREWWSAQVGSHSPTSPKRMSNRTGRVTARTTCHSAYARSSKAKAPMHPSSPWPGSSSSEGDSVVKIVPGRWRNWQRS